MSYYPIELDKSRNFKYGMRALDRIEKKLKVNIAKLNMENLSIEETTTLIWAGLVHEDKTLTVDRVMDLIDEYSNMAKVTEAMNKAFEDAFSGGVEQKEVAEETKN